MVTITADILAPSHLSFTRALAITEAYWVHITTRTQEQLNAIDAVLAETHSEKLAFAHALTEAAKNEADYHFMFEVDEYEE